jgi:hypothetical protein
MMYVESGLTNNHHHHPHHQGVDNEYNGGYQQCHGCVTTGSFEQQGVEASAFVMYPVVEGNGGYWHQQYVEVGHQHQQQQSFDNGHQVSPGYASGHHATPGGENLQQMSNSAYLGHDARGFEQGTSLVVGKFDNEDGGGMTSDVSSSKVVLPPLDDVRSPPATAGTVVVVDETGYGCAGGPFIGTAGIGHTIDPANYSLPPLHVVGPADVMNATHHHLVAAARQDHQHGYPM